MVYFASKAITESVATPHQVKLASIRFSKTSIALKTDFGVIDCTTTYIFETKNTLHIRKSRFYGIHL
jgi:hypothetical protein